MEKVKWHKHFAAIYRPKNGRLKPILELDEISLDELYGIKEQKLALCENTRAFLDGKGGLHALLWGAKGTGKSSLIKAVFNEYKAQNLRLVEIAKDDLNALPEIIDKLRKSEFKFIIFCDDFSFENDDDSYKFLKPLMEGSIEKVPNNVLIYASSNRRHLLKESLKDNEEAYFKDGELHLGDANEERLSLSDRFGLWLGFYATNLDEYLKMIDFYFKDCDINKELLHEKARQFASLRASRNGRTARQFYTLFKDNL